MRGAAPEIRQFYERLAWVLLARKNRLVEQRHAFLSNTTVEFSGDRGPGSILFRLPHLDAYARSSAQTLHVLEGTFRGGKIEVTTGFEPTGCVFC